MDTSSRLSLFPFSAPHSRRCLPERDVMTMAGDVACPLKYLCESEARSLVARVKLQ
jgi:hypothetical protein